MSKIKEGKLGGEGVLLLLELLMRENGEPHINPCPPWATQAAAVSGHAVVALYEVNSPGR